ncbi:hypothetical protein M422DRAFT_163806, partial [Sphaerobolus stellatus SS14]
MLGGTASQADKARSLITNIVNTMSTHMQIGAPMAAAYLLGMSDHYSSHKFRQIYWKPYIRYILQSFQDYVMRPIELEDVSLYEWFTSFKKVKLRKEDDNLENCDDQSGSSDVIDETLDIININADMSSFIPVDMKLNRKCLWHTAFNCANEVNSPMIEETRNSFLTFLPKHPQHRRFKIIELSGTSKVVPNFMGGSLPKKESSHINYYSVTMLTLFKPWRKCSDLAVGDSAWSEVFDSFEFSKGQLQLMKNFNIRHECIDSLDDYHAQMKK